MRPAPPSRSFCSLFQKPPHGGERTEEEQTSFKRGLGAMASLYASMTGTAVLLQRRVPARPQDVQMNERDDIEVLAEV